MARQFSSEPDELGQPRFVQFTNRVDRWLHDRATAERRSLAWVIRELVTDAYQEAQVATQRKRAG